MSVLYVPRAFGGTLVITLSSLPPAIALVVSTARRDNTLAAGRRANVLTVARRDDLAITKVRQ